MVEGVVGSARVGGGGAFPFLGEGLVSPFDFGLAGAAAGAVLVAPIIVFCWVEGLTATREPEEPVFTCDGEAKFAPCWNISPAGLLPSLFAFRLVKLQAIQRGTGRYYADVTPRALNSSGRFVPRKGDFFCFETKGRLARIPISLPSCSSPTKITRGAGWTGWIRSSG